jgi:DNA-binding MarR family transcriptional regulator/GNAT superfamily N-acetyltransferase
MLSAPRSLYEIVVIDVRLKRPTGCRTNHASGPWGRIDKDYHTLSARYHVARFRARFQSFFDVIARGASNVHRGGNPFSKTFVDLVNISIDNTTKERNEMNDTPRASTDPIACIRAFNRFYTRQMGLLNEGLLHSEYSLTEVRVLYELAHRDQPSAAELVRDLGIDAGYLSRILKKFESQALLLRSPSDNDRRQLRLTLTETGRTTFAPLNAASEREVSALLGRLGPVRAESLVEAMTRIRRILGDTEAPLAPYLLRPLRVGDIGWITHRQAVLYAREFGWDETFEGLVAEIAGAFVRNHDPRSEGCWIAEREGAVVGSVFLVRDTDTVAKLRLLYVEPEARGLGIGERLVRECIRFARDHHYRTLTLWTNDVLVSARRIYQACGFQLVREEPHTSFGKELIGQYWELSLVHGRVD